jgi:hypothetical protein
MIHEASAASVDTRLLRVKHERDKQDVRDRRDSRRWDFRPVPHFAQVSRLSRE